MASQVAGEAANRGHPHIMFSVIDVRDMQCAQALAQAAQAMQQLPAGAVLELACNADDVRHDLLAWAEQLGHPVLGTEVRDGETRFKIQKRHD